MLVRARAHVRANLVAYVALFFALSGTGAYASHLVVRSTDIVNGQVKGPDLAASSVSGAKIAGRSVQPSDLAAVPHARAILSVSGSQTIGAMAPIKVVLNQLAFGSGLTLSSGSLVVATPGVYALTGSAHWEANATGVRALWVTRSGDGLGTYDQTSPAATNDTLHTVSLLARFEAGDTIDLMVSHNAAVSLALVDHDNVRASLDASWVGP